MTNINPLLKVTLHDDGYGIRNRTAEEMAEGVARLIAERRFGSANVTRHIDIAWECGKLRASCLNVAERKKVSDRLKSYLPNSEFKGKLRIHLKAGLQSGSVEVMPN